MFERFTERARQVVVLAQNEARDLNDHHIGSRHILYGLAAEENGLAAITLSELGVTRQRVHDHIEAEWGKGDADLSEGGQIPFTPEATKDLELALREALSLGHNYIGTEHILLALLRNKDGGTNLLLTRLVGLDWDTRIREMVLRRLQGVGAVKSVEPDPPPKDHLRISPVTSAYTVYEARDPDDAYRLCELLNEHQAPDPTEDPGIWIQVVLPNGRRGLAIIYGELVE